MADTPRTLATLLALCADNTTGDITAQVVRDALVSLAPARGQITLASSAATTFLQSNTYVSVAGTTTLDTTVSTADVTMPGNGQLRFGKAVAQVVQITAHLLVLPAGNNHTYAFVFAKNGNPVTQTAATYQFGSLGGNAALVTLHALVAVAANDILSVQVRNNTDTTSITASMMTLSAVALTT